MIGKIKQSIPALLGRGLELLPAKLGLPFLHGFQILVYHRVQPTLEPLVMAPIATTQFDAQMKMIAKYFRPISLTQLISELESGIYIKGTVCVTFDDGYADNYQYALPILQNYKVPATVFVATDFVGTNKLLWYDRVLDAFKRTQKKSLEIEFAGLAGIPLVDLQTRNELAFQMLGALKKLAPIERDKIIDALFVKAEVAEDSKSKIRQMLSWDEVRELYTQGIEIGAHTCSHPILTLLSQAEIESEVFRSKQMIENELQASIKLFAYPNGQPGDFNEITKGILKKCGFSCALTTVNGVNDQNQDRFELLRRQPWEKDIPSLHARMFLERMRA